MMNVAFTSSRRRSVGDNELRSRVEHWKSRFFGSSWARYDEAVSGSFRLVPPPSRLSSLRQDYQTITVPAVGRWASDDASTRDADWSSVGFTIVRLPEEIGGISGAFDSHYLLLCHQMGEYRVANRLMICVSFSQRFQNSIVAQLCSFIDFVEPVHVIVTIQRFHRQKYCLFQVILQIRGSQSQFESDRSTMYDATTNPIKSIQVPLNSR